VSAVEARGTPPGRRLSTPFSEPPSPGAKHAHLRRSQSAAELSVILRTLLPEQQAIAPCASA
jgi:hypothetical protein